MLRVVLSAEEKEAHAARLRRIRQKRYHARQAAGLMTVPGVLIDARILNLLIDRPPYGLGWLRAEDANHPERIGKAISEGLKRLAEGLQR
jgi:hypothetical protein